MKILLGVLAVLLISTPVSADTLKIASWNIEHLRDTTGEGPRPRTNEDFRQLREHAQRLDADVIALQEVENVQALGRVFDPTQYTVLVSSRRSEQRTGFAVRKPIVVIRHPDLDGLNTSGGLRHGVDIEISVGERTVRLLSIHLKSFCFEGPIKSPTTSDCVSLAKQIPELERWIDDRAVQETPFFVLGDFNRRFDAPDDDFWPEIADGDPGQLTLVRATAGLEAECNPQYSLFIDHIVYDGLASRWILPNSFEELEYPGIRLSDHCPISVKMDMSR